MLSENKTLKDSIKDTVSKPTSWYGTGPEKKSVIVSYTKTNKLVTALYMVTDIIEKEEPVRSKLRNLGIEIVSDMHSIPIKADGKIAEIVSLLNIASAMNFISEMNCNILKKEFFELRASIQESIDMKPKWLEDFFVHSHPTLDETYFQKSDLDSTKQSIGHKNISKGQYKRTRIGVQKGSTLMKALSDKTRLLSDNTTVNLNENAFNSLKKKRRENIINIIKSNGGDSPIRDIISKINVIGTQGELSFGEKTLQRELVSMVKDGVLNKTGEKRWSRYQLVNPLG